MAPPTRLNDAIGAFRFKVELDGLLVGGFSEVTGVGSETEVMEFPEGGLNTHVHYWIKQTKYTRIVLKRGMTQSSELWDWYDGVAGGNVQRKNGSVILYNHGGNEICRWNFFEAFPVKWIGPSLNAAGNSLAVESIEIVHNGLKAIFSK
ncbi:phage tail protein [Paenibacillus ginsengarvi]|jgi:phage tail-like protein|uniref:Phage tail protein n=1 Tax=Paenibacillus ginsengarvi TaxID=400777 RepID=A0A3B0BRQ6_9BACL|nr:phage tail protein [Paenibacillus ginsengarvi]RKN75973.1 phage tail protein [Paenibacillus ginsengarvi]